MGEKIRVLHVLGGLNRGGAETMIMNVYRKIDRSKIQFDFIIHTSDKCDYNDEIKALGGRIYSLPRYTGKNHFLYKKAWNSFYKQHPEYKIVHGHVRSTAVIYLRIAKKYDIITIAHSHSTSSGTGFSARVKNIMQYPIRDIADYFFACSFPAGEWLFGKETCKKENFFIYKNAIDLKKFIFDKEKRIEKRKELKIEDKYVIGHIGRFNVSKNHGFLIDIFKKVHDKNDKAILLLIGEGELRPDIEKKVADLKMTSCVIFAESRSDIPEILNAIDVFLFPSLFEGLGIVAIEAQASGLQCIVADTIPKEAYVTDLIESIDLKASVNFWADKILEYSSGYVRRNTYEEICQRGYDIVKATQWLERFYLEKILMLAKRVY